MNHLLVRTFALSSLLCIGTSLSAQSPELQRDIKLVNALVKELRFIEMAQFEVEAMKVKYQKSDDFKDVAQLAIQVALGGAKRHADRKEQGKLFAAALEQSSDFIQRYSGEEVAEQARNTLSQACHDYGIFLIGEIELAGEDEPERIPELEAEAAKVFRQGEEACDQVRAHMEKQGKDEEVDYYLTWMRKGVLLREHGRAIKKDRDYLLTSASELLEELVLKIGEETPLGQRALFEMAQVEDVRGDMDLAIVLFQDTIDNIYEALTNEREEMQLPPATKALILSMMQEVYDTQAKALLKQGNGEQVLAQVNTFREQLKELNAKPDPRFGDSLLLTEARVMAASGSQVQVSAALKAAKDINDRHPADFVGLKAKNLIRDLMASSGDLVTGDLLMEVAKGDYQNKEYDAAIAGFKKALGSMDEETAGKLGLETWDLIGRSNQAKKRDLEACLAFGRGLDLYGKGEQSQFTAGMANRGNRAIQRVLKSSNQDPTMQPLRNRMEKLLQTYDSRIGDGLSYRNAEKKKGQGKYAEAARLYKQVPLTFVKYELAQAHAIDCLRRDGKIKDARAAMASFRKWQEDPANAITKDAKDSKTRLAFRSQSIAWISYGEGLILYGEASGKGGDGTKFPAVIEHFQSFEQQHGKSAQPQMPRVHDILGHAFLASGNLAEALGRYQTLQKLGNGEHLGLGLRLLNYDQEQIKARQLAYETARSDDPQAQNTKEAYKLWLGQRQEALRRSLDYCKTVASPDYWSLNVTMKLAEGLKDWSSTEWAAQKIRSVFGSKANYENRILHFVLPSLGHALLKQGDRLQEAYDVLSEAEKALGVKKTKSYFEVYRLVCLAQGGWPEFDESGLNFRIQPGLGQKVAAIDRYYHKPYKDYATSSKNGPRYSLPWYRFHMEAFFFAKRAGGEDSQYSDWARTLYSKAQSTDDFETLRNLGPEGEEVFNLFQQVHRMN